jgi:hypothetical protein
MNCSKHLPVPNVALTHAQRKNYLQTQHCDPLAQTIIDLSSTAKKKKKAETETETPKTDNICHQLKKYIEVKHFLKMTNNNY